MEEGDVWSWRDRRDVRCCLFPLDSVLEDVDVGLALSPAFDFKPPIPNLVSQLEPTRRQMRTRCPTDVIFIDGGSRDRTVELIPRSFAQDSSVRFIRLRKNLGLGTAFRTGFAAVAGDLVVTMDSDCTYLPTEIAGLIACLDPHNGVVTASPYHQRGNLVGAPPYRLPMSISLSAVYRLLLRLDIHTFT